MVTFYISHLFYGMSLLSHNAWLVSHVYIVYNGQIKEKKMAIRARPNKDNLETHIQNEQISHQSLGKFQFHSPDASL